MARLFSRWPHAIRATREVADACRFALTDLSYDYPRRTAPPATITSQLSLWIMMLATFMLLVTTVRLRCPSSARATARAEKRAKRD